MEEWCLLASLEHVLARMYYNQWAQASKTVLLSNIIGVTLQCCQKKKAGANGTLLSLIFCIG